MPDFSPFTRSRLTDPDTSHEAAAGISLRMTAIRYKVLQHFAHYPRMTDLDLQRLCNDHGSTYRTRRSELVQMGMVEDSKERRMQEGTKRIIWQVTFSGLTAIKIGKP